MEGVGRRSKRIIEKKIEVKKEPEPVSGLRRWSEEEQMKLLRCLKLYGHNNVEKMVEALPGRSADDIRKYLLVIHSDARSKADTQSNIHYWLSRSKSEMEKNTNVKTSDNYHLALSMKCLAVDGLIENHPDPAVCNGIDFVAAYRLLYQALLGYPLQPVNKATSDFICETFINVNANKDLTSISMMTDLLRNKFGEEKNEDGQTNSVNTNAGTSGQNNDNSYSIKKPVKVYQRKRPAKSVSDVPPIKVVLKEGDNAAEGNMKYYSLEIEGNKNVSSVAVPVPLTVTQDKLQLEDITSKLWSSVGFNPLGLPEAVFKKRNI
ncbi:UNVERIFIED_CONTAM: hypothetical protein PYX00_005883 [Menopon gallinae]|uniref:Myb-like domain-containing protein n=1 Tax=Menopon gallinae TaxID=328185 RepID=A0AAW2HT82_9NEOP